MSLGPTLGVIRLRREALKEDPGVLTETRKVAGAVAHDANRTSAKIGITYRDLPDGEGVRIGPTGAAGLPTEIGTRRTSAHRFVKNALDKRRIR